ncbi:MAG TPA: 4-hydroxy-tetrahydrodipicolinate reductase [Tepidisphaeraceae bacterium]|jgi:4-hydroxy-tetrahydrodipicolinate reductase
MAISIGISGATGRMGRRLIALSKEADLKVVAATGKAGSQFEKQDVGRLAGIGDLGVAIQSDLTQTPRVLIDFSSPEGMRHWLKVCRDKKIAMVIGTTGLSASDHPLIDQAAADIAVLQSPNMSLGVNLLFKLVTDAAKILGDDYDIEIVEGHHRFKKDAPSGTAMGVADAILRATGKSKDSLIFGRHGEIERKRGEIGVHSLRIGDEVGQHTAYFAALGERLELKHVATNRDTFAHGALRAAKWIADKKPGRYTMRDVLGI